MTQNNNFSVLPFYDSIILMNHRKSYAYDEVYPLFASSTRLLPFQIIRTEHSENQITSVKVINSKGEVTEILTEMLEAGLTIAPREDYDVIVFPATKDLKTPFDIGLNRLEITDGIDVWYSELFTIVNMIPVDGKEKYLKIEWWDESNLLFDAGEIVYANPNFRNRLYLCTEVGKPDYKFEEEGEERDGYFFPEKQISKKLYNFTAIASEYLCDAMRFIRMSDHVVITDMEGRTYKCDTFLMTPNWQGQGYYASIECQFTTDTIVKKLAKGYGMI